MADFTEIIRRFLKLDPKTVRLPTGQSYNPDTYKPARENMKKGGKVKSASERADGIAIRGRTRAR